MKFIGVIIGTDSGHVSKKYRKAHKKYVKILAKRLLEKETITFNEITNLIPKKLCDSIEIRLEN